MRLVEVNAVLAIPEGTNACDLLFLDKALNSDVLLIEWEETRLKVVKEAEYFRPDEDIYLGPEVTALPPEPNFEEVTLPFEGEDQ